MNRSPQPEIEIRDALDREVRRVFDAARLAATLEQRRLHEPAPREAGPLSRVPPLVQWIGVVAAVIAAVTGLRSLVVELTAPEPAPVIAQRAATESGVEPEPPVVHAAEIEPSRPSPPIEPPASRTRDEVQLGPAPTERAAATIAESPAAAAPHAPRPAPVQTPALAGAPELERPEAHAPAAPAQAPAARTTAALPPIVQATFPRLAEQALRGVRVTSLRLGERELTGELVDVPELAATLVAIRGEEEPRVASRGRRTFGPPVVTSRDELQQAPLYVRVLVGTAEGSLSSTPHVIVDRELLELVTVEELEQVAESWPDQGRVLERRFKLSSIVALDAFRIGEREESRRFVALVGDRRYEMRVTRDRPGSGIGLVIAPHEGDESIRATMSIEHDRLAILAVPERMLPGGDARHAGDMLFVTLSAVSLETLERVTGQPRIVDDPEHPAILLSETGGRFEIGTGRAEVRLLALVDEDGRVAAIRVLEYPPDPEGEAVVLDAAETVRGWRYLPARHRGLEVATWVEIALSRSR